MTKIFVLAIVGGIIAFLVAFFYISFGIAYTDILKSFGFFVTDGEYSFAQMHPDIAQYMAIRYFIYGSVGLSAGIIGIIGGRVSKVKGGILLVVASGISILAFGYLGIISFVLFLISGVFAFKEKPTLQQTTVMQNSP